jgi:hypothetical protein
MSNAPRQLEKYEEDVLRELKRDLRKIQERTYQDYLDPEDIETFIQEVPRYVDNPQEFLEDQIHNLGRMTLVPDEDHVNNRCDDMDLDCEDADDHQVAYDSTLEDLENERQEIVDRLKAAVKALDRKQLGEMFDRWEAKERKGTRRLKKRLESL